MSKSELLYSMLASKVSTLFVIDDFRTNGGRGDVEGVGESYIEWLLHREILEESPFGRSYRGRMLAVSNEWKSFLIEVGFYREGGSVYVRSEVLEQARKAHPHTSFAGVRVRMLMEGKWGSVSRTKVEYASGQLPPELLLQF